MIGTAALVKETKHRNVRFVLRTLVHCLCVCLYYCVLGYGLIMALTIKSDYLNMPQLSDLRYFTPAFLTNWNLIFQTVFLSLSLVYDVLTWLDKHEANLALKIRYFRDIIFCALVVPYTLFVSSMFWTLFLIDRELVFPEVYDLIVPWWFNHCVHTNITIVVLLETLLQARRHPTDLKLELIMNGTVGVAYAIVYYAIYFFANRWLYAVFGVLTWWQVCLYQLMIWASCFIFYFIQFPINRLFHREEDILNAPVATTDDINYMSQGLHKNDLEKSGNREAEDLTKPWSLKYRQMDNQVENSSL